MSFDAGQGLISNKFNLNIFFCFLAWETLLNAYDHGIQCNCWMHACCLYSQSCYTIQSNFFVQVKFWIFEWQKVQSYFFSNWKRYVKEASNMGRSEMKTVRTERKWMWLKHCTEWFLQELSKFMKTFKPAVSFCSWSPISANIHNRELTIFVYLWSLCWIQHVSIIWTNNITWCQIHLASF